MRKAGPFLWLLRGLLALLGLLLLALTVSAIQVTSLRTYNPELTAFQKLRLEQARDRGVPMLIRQEWLSYEEIPAEVLTAIIWAEDDTFWEHDGFDWDGIRKAAEKNRRAGKTLRGASTITQQLAKNLYLSPKRSYLRKAREAVLTVMLEKLLSKQRIMELYLNVIEMGPGVFGVEAGAWYQFGRPLHELSQAEIAQLISIIPSPLRYDVHGEFVARQSRSLQRRIGWLLPDTSAQREDSLALAEADSLEALEMTEDDEALLDSLLRDMMLQAEAETLLQVDSTDSIAFDTMSVDTLDSLVETIQLDSLNIDSIPAIDADSAAVTD